MRLFGVAHRGFAAQLDVRVIDPLAASELTPEDVLAKRPSQSELHVLLLRLRLLETFRLLPLPLLEAPPARLAGADERNQTPWRAVEVLPPERRIRCRHANAGWISVCAQGGLCRVGRS